MSNNLSISLTGTTVTLDETAGLQNDATSNTAGDLEDNDIAATSLPSVFSNRLSVLGVGSPIRAAESGYNGSNSGSSVFTITTTGTISDIAFTDSVGNLLDGDDSGLVTLDGRKIFLYTDTSNNDIVLGREGTAGGSADPNGTIVFAAYLDASVPLVSGSGVNIWTVLYEPLAHPDGANPDDALNLAGKLFITADVARDFSLSDAPSGSNLFLMFGDQTAAIVVTGKAPANQSGLLPNSTVDDLSITMGDTVVTSGAATDTTIGTNNQMIDPPSYDKQGSLTKAAEGMVFSFVTGANTDFTVPNLSQNEADLESNIQFSDMLNVSAASFEIVQLQPSKAATVKVTAYYTATLLDLGGVETGTSYIDGLLVNDTTVNITRVVIRNAVTGGVLLDSDVSLSGSGMTIDLSGDSAVIKGVKADYEVQYYTSADHNRVLIENVGDRVDANLNASFDIGGFALLESSGATAEIGSTVIFEDDGPTIVAAAPADTLVLNTQDAQTIAGAYDTDSKDFAPAFTLASSSYGADGAGSTVWSFALGVTTPGGDSGLKSDGATVYVYLVGGKVVGSTSATEVGITAANTVFDLAVSTAGVVTLTQYAEIDHALPGDTSNYAAQQAVLVNGTVTLTGTVLITDGDGDTTTDSQVLDLGGNIEFDDDGPAVTAAAPTDSLVLNTQDAQTLAGASDSDSQDFSAAFTLGSSSYGADGAGSAVWSFALDVTSPGGDSGLKSDGATVYLYLVDGKVIGSTSVSAGGIKPANTVFDLSVSAAGVVTLSQYAEIDHALPGDSSNYAAQQVVLANGKVTLTGTVLITDGDGDTTTDSQVLDLGGNVKFDDDGPAITAAAPTDTLVLNTQDAQTVGDASDTDSQNFASAFTLASSGYGADGAGSTVWSFALGVTTPGGDSGLKSDGATVYLYLIGGKVVGSTSSTVVGVVATNTVFDLSVSTAGVVTLSQYGEIDHVLPGDTSNYAVQQAVLANGKVTLTGTVLITDGDGDTATDSHVLDLGGNIKFDDDGPAVAAAVPTDSLVLNTQDAQTLAGASDSDSQNFASAFTLASSGYGADGAGSTVWSFTLGVTTPGGDSGLKSDGATVYLYLIGGKVVGSTSSTVGGVVAANTVFDLSVSTAGVVTLTQYAEIDHALPGATSNYAVQQSVLANGKVTLTGTVLITDGDGDTATDSQTIDLGGNVKFDDDGPAVNAITNLVGFNAADPLKGTYDFTIGADGVGNAASDGTVLLSLSGTTGGGAITDTSVSFVAENDTSVTYSFSFKYYAGPDSTQQSLASGTVVFNKLDGTYVFDLDEAISGQVTFSTSAPLASSNYDTIGNNSPEIVVQKYSDNFYGVLSAKSAAPPSDVSDLVSGGDHAYTAGETFTSESPAYVNVATNTVGVNSDTVQNGELLNFDFYVANPVSGPVSPPQQPGASIDGSTPKAYATALSITLAQFTKGEDVAILLKLYNPDFATNGLPEYTTKLLIANKASDYQTVGSYKVVSVTESNYDSAHYQIYGVQVLSSTENVTGTGYSLSSDATVNLTASGSNYADTSDSDVFKIIKIDVTTASKSNFDTDLQFTGQVIDGDSDSASFSFNVHLEASSSVLTGTSGSDYLNGTSVGDTLDGGTGNDVLAGGAGDDIFRFSTLPAVGNLDTVSDFVVGQDKIALLTSVFTLGGNGALDTGEFASLASGSEQAGAYLVFNQGDQTLYYDADGAANGNAVAVVTLTGVANLAATDLQFYS